jgi:hypothetical protein
MIRARPDRDVPALARILDGLETLVASFERYAEGEQRHACPEHDRDEAPRWYLSELFEDLAETDADRPSCPPPSTVNALLVRDGFATMEPWQVNREFNRWRMARAW